MLTLKRVTFLTIKTLEKNLSVCSVWLGRPVALCIPFSFGCNLMQFPAEVGFLELILGAQQIYKTTYWLRVWLPETIHIPKYSTFSTRTSGSVACLLTVINALTEALLI